MEITDTRVVQALLRVQGVELEEMRSSVRAHVPDGGERFLAERGIRLPERVADPARDLADDLPRDRPMRVNGQLMDPLRREFPGARFHINLARLEG